MKNLLRSWLLATFLFGSAFVIFQPDTESINLHLSENVADNKTDATDPALNILNPEFLSSCATGFNLTPTFSEIFPSEKENSFYMDGARDCAQCGNNELCVEGRCISLDRIERASQANFDSECSRTRCGEGEFCIAGNCFQPTRTSMSQSSSCLNVDCGQYYVCYYGVCYPFYNMDEDRPIQCSNREDTANKSYPRCDDGEYCFEDRCLPAIERLPPEVFQEISNCGNLLAGVSGGCIQPDDKSCRNCSTGDVCVGGHCVELTPQMGVPCDSQPCPDNARCISGFCVNI